VLLADTALSALFSPRESGHILRCERLENLIQSSLLSRAVGKTASLDLRQQVA